MNGDAVVATGTAENLTGQPLELHLDDADGVPAIVTIATTPILSGTFSGTIPFELAGAPLADGRYRLWVDATDDLGNIASEQAASDVDAWITLDRTAPSLAFDWPPPEGLNPAGDPAAADSDPVSSGALDSSGGPRECKSLSVGGASTTKAKRGPLTPLISTR